MPKTPKKIKNIPKQYKNKFKKYFINENKPWNKASLYLYLGINEDYIYNIRHKRIKTTKEHDLFLNEWNKALDKIEQDLLKELLQTPQGKAEYWRLAFQLPRNKKLEKELEKESQLNNNIQQPTININLEKPREINSE